MDPKVTIVIVNWNGIQDTIECLESLMKIEYSNFNIIIVDNNSSNNEVDKLKEKFNNIKIIVLKQNLGFANANNIGIRVALNEDSDYVLLLNNDTVVDKKFLNELVKVAQTNPRIGILGSKEYYYDDKKRIWYAGGKINMYYRHNAVGAHQIDHGQFESLQETDWVTGACILVRKNVFESIGLLPREYFMNWEDIDFCTAARKNNYICMFVPSSIIWHKVSASFARHSLVHKQIFLGFRNRVLMRYKYLSKPGFVLFILLHLFVSMPLTSAYFSFIVRDPRRIKAMFKGFFAGIKERGTKKIKFNFD